MDPSLITAATGLLLAIGGAVGFFIRRSDKKRETTETIMIEHFKSELVKAERRVRFLERVNRALHAGVNTYREQLIRNDIEPDPRYLKLPAEEDFS